MSRLEDLTPNATVRGVAPDGMVTVGAVQWFVPDVRELAVTTVAGAVPNEALHRQDEVQLEVIGQARAWSFDGDGELFRLVSEGHRTRLACLSSSVLAVDTAHVEPGGGAQRHGGADPHTGTRWRPSPDRYGTASPSTAGVTAVFKRQE